MPMRVDSFEGVHLCLIFFSPIKMCYNWSIDKGDTINLLRVLERSAHLSNSLPSVSFLEQYKSLYQESVVISFTLSSEYSLPTILFSIYIIHSHLHCNSQLRVDLEPCFRWRLVKEVTLPFGNICSSKVSV